MAGLEKAAISFYKLDSRGRPEDKEGRFQCYPILRQGPLQGDKTADELLTLLVNPKSYGEKPATCFSPGMGLRFKAADVERDLVICLDCLKIKASDGGNEQTWVLSPGGGAGLLRIYYSQLPKPERFAEEAKAWLDGFDEATLTFYKLDPNLRGQKRVPKPEDELFRDYLVLEKKPIKVEKSVKELRAILVDPTSYGETAFSCFDPGMGLRFKVGETEGDLVICLACARIQAFKGERRDAWILSKEGAQRLHQIYEAQVPMAEKK
jgi:hypothetical protein